MNKNITLKSCAQLLLFALLLCLLCLLALVMLTRDSSAAVFSEETGGVGSVYPTVVIDAGHGGEDGGCMGFDGTEEKNLNLAVAKKLAAMLRAADVDVIMTREDDALLYDRFGDLEDYKGQKKIYDLKNRCRIANECKNAILVSIHMNSFPDGKYSGLQVWYSKNRPESRLLAEKIQGNVLKYLQRDNERKVKPADSAIYLLDRASCPAVLVECGFLSNEEELSALKDEKYRGELCTVLFSAVLNFMNEYISMG